MSLKSPEGYGTVPFTTATTTTSAAASESAPLSSSPASISLQPTWRELLDPTSFSLPDSYAEAMSRITRNLTRFRTNYATVMLFIFFLSVLWHTVSMMVLIFMLMVWTFVYSSRDEVQQVVIFGRTVDYRPAVLGSLILPLVTVLLYPGGAVNVLVSLLISSVIIGFHAAFRVADDMFFDKENGRECKPAYSDHGLSKPV